MTRCATLVVSLLGLAALPGCNKTTTTIPLTWRNPAFQSGGFQKLFVIGVGEDDARRRLFEDEFAKALALEGAAAQASWGLLPQSKQLTEEQLERVQSENASEDEELQEVFLMLQFLHQF